MRKSRREWFRRWGGGPPATGKIEQFNGRMYPRSLFLLGKIMRGISDLTIENRGRSENAFYVVETIKKTRALVHIYIYIYIRLGTYHISAPSMTRKRRRPFFASRFYSLRASIATITIKSISNEEEKQEDIR